MPIALEISTNPNRKSYVEAALRKGRLLFVIPEQEANKHSPGGLLIFAQMILSHLHEADYQDLQQGSPIGVTPNTFHLTTMEDMVKKRALSKDPANFPPVIPCLEHYDWWNHVTAEEVEPLMTHIPGLKYQKISIEEVFILKGLATPDQLKELARKKGQKHILKNLRKTHPVASAYSDRAEKYLSRMSTTVHTTLDAGTVVQVIKKFKELAQKGNLTYSLIGRFFSDVEFSYYKETGYPGEVLTPEEESLRNTFIAHMDMNLMFHGANQGKPIPFTGWILQKSEDPQKTLFMFRKHLRKRMDDINNGQIKCAREIQEMKELCTSIELGFWTQVLDTKRDQPETIQVLNLGICPDHWIEDPEWLQNQWEVSWKVNQFQGTAGVTGIAALQLLQKMPQQAARICQHQTELGEELRNYLASQI